MLTFRQTAPETLRAIHLFGSLEDEDLAFLAAGSRVKKYVDHEMIAGPWMDGRPLIALTQGEARLYRQGADGREKTLGVVRGGQLVGLPLLAEDIELKSILEATTRSSALLIPAQRFERLLERRPGLAIDVIKELGRRLVRANDEREQLAGHRVAVKVAHALLELTDGYTRETIVNVSQAELSAWVGSGRDSVGRALRELETEGLIRLHQGRVGVEIVDRAALAVRSEHD